MKDNNLGNAICEVFAALNVLSGGKARAEIVRSTFFNTHRTLQQQFVGVVIIPILQHLAQAHEFGAVDDRNRASAALASKMLAAVTEDDLYLPFI